MTGSSNDQFVHLLSQRKSQLQTDNTDKEEKQSNLKNQDLGVDFEKTDARVPIKSLPGFMDSKSSQTTDDSRNDLPSVGAVKGNDRLLFFGKKRTLNADQHDLSWDVDDKGCNDGDEGNRETSSHMVHAKFPRLDLVDPGKAKKADRDSGDEDRGLFCESKNGSGNDDPLGIFIVGNAAIPWL